MASGIGFAVAARAVREGATVVLAGRRRSASEQAAARLAEGQPGEGRAVFVRADVTIEADAARLVQAAVADFGRLDGAFNNAGGVNAARPVNDLEDSAWQAEIAQNLTSVYYCMKHQIAAIVTARSTGSIVNNASIGGSRGIAGLGAYVAAKHGVVGLTRSAALENARRGIRVNALVTGNVDTPLYRSLIGAPTEGELPGPAPNPIGRVASADEVAAFVAFLLSDESAFVTGAALAIDGGATAQ